MFNNNVTPYLLTLRRADLMREAEQARLAKLVQVRPLRRFYDPAMFVLGREMIRLGSRLQNRYHRAQQAWRENAEIVPTLALGD